ncbi:SusD/RagB family nutrient-binding outer membrane lipoprotein [Flavobacterium sp.]|uniref:SusD/RagB family nutrient-binding outer membrane lipoprotein n=1 Tax=Flavobacterium sp. TaxID=239 RepID=UPI0039E5BC0A
MKMKKNIFKSFLLLAVLALGSCETFDLDQTDNPSTLPADKLDPVYVFNNVQLTLPDFVNSANGFTQRMTRQMAMTNGTSYDNSFAPVDFDNNWTTAYLMLNSIKVMEPKATENGQNFILGASKIIRCYVLLTLTDMYGSIPYSEALQGNANLTPKYDSSEAVYAGVYNELNDAIELLGMSDNSNGALAARDLYFGTGTINAKDPAKWITLAKTLKFKMLCTARLATGFGGININTELAALMAENDLINDSAKDFAFKYGTERDVPNSRHPQYNDHYELGSGAYIANYFFWAVNEEKVREVGTTLQNVVDPRFRYYFFKQKDITNQVLQNAQAVPCKSLSRPAHYSQDQYSSFYNLGVRAAYCTSVPRVDDSQTNGRSLLGRDHGDASGIPLDDDLRTIVGVYPAGGLIGAPVQVNSFVNAGLRGGLGAGIMPMVLSSYVHFLKAEAILKLGMAGDAKVELEQAIRQSVTKTTTLLPQYAPGMPDTPNTQAQINTLTDTYVAYVLERYDASSEADKLQIIIKEYYIAAWGNGIEPYNNYRRTGYPDNFQPTVEENPGAYFSTALYAGASVNNNPNAPSNVRTKRVFWDLGGFELH